MSEFVYKRTQDDIDAEVAADKAVVYGGSWITIPSTGTGGANLGESPVLGTDYEMPTDMIFTD